MRLQEPCAHKKGKRLRRQSDEGEPATIEVFSGLYVNEADSPENDEVTSEKAIYHILTFSFSFSLRKNTASTLKFKTILL